MADLDLDLDSNESQGDSVDSHLDLVESQWGTWIDLKGELESRLDSVRTEFELIRTQSSFKTMCPTQASNGANEKKFFYAGLWPLKEKE